MTKLFQQTRFLTSAFELSQLPPDHGIEIAFAGRSNAGKSTAINCLTRQHKLCKTSKTPGRTQLINFFVLDSDHKLVDLPGYGFAKVSKKIRSHWDLVLSTFLLQRDALRGIVIVVDIRRGISDLDQALIDMVGSSLALHILLTKSDKLPRSAIKGAIEQARGQLGSDDHHSVSSLSAISLEGLDELERKCGQWLELM